VTIRIILYQCENAPFVQCQYMKQLKSRCIDNDLLLAALITKSVSTIIKVYLFYRTCLNNCV